MVLAGVCGDFLTAFERHRQRHLDLGDGVPGKNKNFIENADCEVVNAGERRRGVTGDQAGSGLFTYRRREAAVRPARGWSRMHPRH